MTTAAPQGDDLRPMLDRWVAAGLIDAAQAERIATTEAAVPPPGLPSPRRETAGYVVEALGYLGATLAALAAFMAVSLLWPGIPAAAELGFAAAGAVLLVGVGAVVSPAGEATARLRGVLWGLATVAVAAFAGVLAVRVGHLPDLTAAQVVAGSAAVAAIALWWRWRRTIQHLALFVALAVTVGVTVANVAPDTGETRRLSAGFAVWLFALAWAGLARRGLLRPVRVGPPLAAVAALIGAQLTMDTVFGDVLGLVTVAGLLGAGVVARQVWLLGLGAIGTIQVVPQVASRLLPENVAAPLAVLAVGLVLLGLAVYLARRRSPAGGAGPTDGTNGP